MAQSTGAPTWSPDGRFIYYESDRLRPMSVWRLPMDAATAKPRGAPERVTVPTEVQFGLSPEANGSFVFAAARQLSTMSSGTRLMRRPPKSGAATDVLKSSRDIWQVSPSPDGKWLALKVDDLGEDLEVTRIDGTGSVRLTNDAYRDRSPVWTADSERLVFFSDRAGHYDAWSIRRDGSGLEQLTKAISVVERNCLLTGRNLIAQVMGSNEPSQLIDLTKPIDERKTQAVPSRRAQHVFRGATPGRPTASSSWARCSLRSHRRSRRLRVHGCGIERIDSSGPAAAW